MLGLRCVFTAVLLTSGMLGGGVAAQDIDCRGSFGSVELRGDLNIAVRCQLTGTEVNGDVTLFAGGSLIARDVRIYGDVEGNRADFVDIDDSFIEGHVRLDEFVGDESTIQNSDIHGNVTLSSNRSRLEMLNNDLDGGLKVTHNSGGVLISGNSIGRNLDCNGNNPAPVGFGNRVDGDTKGQCRNLGQESEDEEEEEEEEEEEAEEEENEPAPPPTPTTSRPPTTSPTPTTSPPRGSSPTPSPPPSPVTPPAPTTSAPPATTSPPATSAPPATAAPPAAAPPAAPPATNSSLVDDDGGAGASGWPVALLFTVLVWRRFVRRRTKV